MKFKPDKFKVNTESPFKGDLLGRKETCETWTQFIKQSNTPFVFAIDTEWGNGKTIFLEMWQAYLEKKEFRTIFFNAWEVDFYDEALPALLGEIQEQLNPHRSFGQKARKLAKQLPKKEMVQVILNAAPLRMGKIASSALNLKLKEYDRVTDYIAYRAAVIDFKKELEKIAEKSQKSEESLEESGVSKPLVIFIDELDRCRPIFAIEVLEKVKHIFDVQGVFFVIALNKKVLSKTIESQYGEIDGNIYLEKFFDKVATLENNKDKFIKGIVDKSSIDMEPEKQEFFIRVFLYISDVFNLSLRTQERMVNLIDIGVNIPGDNLGSTLLHNRLYLCILLFLTTIHASEYELFRKVVDLLNRQVINQTVIPDESIVEPLNEKVKLLKQFTNVDYVTKEELRILCKIVDVFVGALNGGGENYNEDVKQFNPVTKIFSIDGFENELLSFYNKFLSYENARKFFLELSKMIDLTKHWSSEQDSEQPA